MSHLGLMAMLVLNSKPLASVQIDWFGEDMSGVGNATKDGGGLFDEYGSRSG